MTQVVAMGETPDTVAWVDVAASAYRAYAASVGVTSMLLWEDLLPATRIAWEAAVRQVGEVLRGGSYGLDTEQVWAGWVPPKPNGAT